MFKFHDFINKKKKKSFMIDIFWYSICLKLKALKYLDRV